MTVPTIKLSSGYEMPMVGLGTWQSKPGEVSASFPEGFEINEKTNRSFRTKYNFAVILKI